MAAIAVVMYHLRYRFYLDYADVAAPTTLAKAFYALTAFGHDAVIVFFVLSGYLISKSVTSAIHENRWSWSGYLSSRLTRLYVVLLPGLALTFLWDKVGLTWFGDHPIYTGESQAWLHDFFPIASRLTSGTFIGNACFLQTAYCPPYGSNDPLWSLAYEFWYYMVFPLGLLVLAVRRIGWWHRFLAGISLAAVLMIMSQSMVLYMPIWLAGAVVGHSPQLSMVSRYWRPIVGMATLTFLVVLCGCHVGSVRTLLGESTLFVDFITGIGFSVLLWLVCHDVRPDAQSIYSTLSRGLSGISYTLYVTHMPALVLLRAALFDVPLEPSMQSMAWFACLLMLALVYAWVVAALTERHTERLRAWLSRQLGVVRAVRRIDTTAVELSRPPSNNPLIARESA